MIILPKVLITGITGFLGKNVCKFFINSGYEVEGIIRSSSNTKKIYNYVNNKIKLWTLDDDYSNLCDIMMLSKPDLVVHTASFSLVKHKFNNIPELISSNILFGTLLLEAMVTNNCFNLINIGSSWQYSVFDTQEYHPMDLYAATKQAFEDIIKFYKEKHGLHCIDLKLFDTYGPYDERKKVLNLFKDCFVTGKKLDTTPGHQKLDLVYIDDVCDCVILASQYLIKKEYEFEGKYSVSSGVQFELAEIAAIMEKVANKKLNVNWGKIPYRDGEIMIPWKGGEKLPGWKCKVDIYKGIALFLK